MRRQFVVALPLLLGWCPWSGSGLDQYTQARLSAEIGLDHATYALKEITAEMRRRESAACDGPSIDEAACKSLLDEHDPWLEKADLAHGALTQAYREVDACRLNVQACRNLSLLFARALVSAAEIIAWAESDGMNLGPSAAEVKRLSGVDSK